MKRYKVVDQSKNGVKVLVHQTLDEQGILGTMVESDCTCYGIPGRTHSRIACPCADKQEK